MMDKNELLDELLAAIAYLRIVGSVYPIAPQKAIDTIEKARNFISRVGDDDDADSLAP